MNDKFNENDSENQVQINLRESVKRALSLEATIEKAKIPQGFILNERGLWFKGAEEDSEPTWLASPIWVVAVSRDTNNEGFGKLVEFEDCDSKKHVYTIPMELLAGDGKELRGILMALGLEITHEAKGRALFMRFLQQSKSIDRARCVRVTGWNGDKCFVLPNTIIGNTEVEKIIFKSDSGASPGYGVKGSLDEWKREISSLCQDNSRLVFSVSLAFAAPLLYRLGEENGGFHFRGPSSTGKTTALNVASSVWGGRSYLQRWRATSNGLEGTALAHNDTLLCLDEIGEMNPLESSEVAYMLANGQSKARADKQGKVKPRASWRLLFLSSGEISLAQHISPVGKTIRGGHQVRVVEIPADTGIYGIFEKLHNFRSGKALSEHLASACYKFYGVASTEFLKALIDKPSLVDKVRSSGAEFLSQAPLGVSSQEARVLNRFALVASAGELATELGITGWTKGEATKAVWTCFNDWIKSRGGFGLYEEKEALNKVVSFFQQYGKSRFSLFDEEEKDRGVLKRAGYRRGTEIENSAKFYVHKEVFKNEICSGLDHTMVAKACIAAGYLIPDSKGNPTRTERLPSTKTRVYVFSYKVLADTELDETDETCEADHASH